MKRTVLAVVTFLGLGTLALAQDRLSAGRSVMNDKLSPDLQSVSPDETVNVIVQFKQPLTERHHQTVVNRGGRLRAPLHAIKAGAYSMPAARLRDLANDPDVAYMSPDRSVQPYLDLAGSATNAALEFQYGMDGSGITVAIIDSGIMDTHPDLQNPSGQSRVLYSESFNLSEGNDYFDRYGHGSHVAGIVGGDASQSAGSNYLRTFRGIAPNVKFVNLKVLDRQGAGTDSMVIAAIQRAIALKSTYNARPLDPRELHEGPFVPGRGSRLEGRHRRRRGGRQPGTQHCRGHQWLRYHHGAWKRPVRHYRGRHENYGHGCPR